jgi:dephospho-CoA kinase
MNRKICIGLTGRMASGKGEVAAFFKQEGYRYISLSDIVREEVARLGKDVTRAEMQDIGNSLRTSGGAGVLGKRVREKIDPAGPQKWIIDGIRNPAEVIELRKIDSFYLIGIDTGIDIIISRIKSRNRDTDNAEKAELKKRLDREWGIGEPEDGQQVGKCLEMADFTIHNDSSLKKLISEVSKISDTIVSLHKNSNRGAGISRQ